MLFYIKKEDLERIDREAGIAISTTVDVYSRGVSFTPFSSKAPDMVACRNIENGVNDTIDVNHRSKETQLATNLARAACEFVIDSFKGPSNATNFIENRSKLVHAIELWAGDNVSKKDVIKGIDGNG